MVQFRKQHLVDLTTAEYNRFVVVHVANYLYLILHFAAYLLHFVLLVLNLLCQLVDFGLAFLLLFDLIFNLSNLTVKGVDLRDQHLSFLFQIMLLCLLCVRIVRKAFEPVEQLRYSSSSKTSASFVQLTLLSHDSVPLLPVIVPINYQCVFRTVAYNRIAHHMPECGDEFLICLNKLQKYCAAVLLNKLLINLSTVHRISLCDLRQIYERCVSQLLLPDKF